MMQEPGNKMHMNMIDEGAASSLGGGSSPKIAFDFMKKKGILKLKNEN